MKDTPYTRVINLQSLNQLMWIKEIAKDLGYKCDIHNNSLFVYEITKKDLEALYELFLQQYDRCMFPLFQQ